MGHPAGEEDISSFYEKRQTVSTAVAKGRRFSRKKAHPLLISGKPVKFRIAQKLLWIALAIALGTGIIAGFYWYILQQDYHNILPFLPEPTSLKAWWDNGMGFIHSGNWTNGIWRHGIRDKGEPETWALIGGVLLGASASVRIIRTRWLILGGIVLLAAIIAGALAITWFTNFGPGKAWGNPFHWQDLVLGFLVGKLLHILWMPMANGVRYQLLSNAGRSGNTPLWVSLPLAPPTLRETWSEMKRDGRLKAAQVKAKQDKFRQSRLFVPLVGFALLIIAITGDLAKYPIAHGAHIPFLNP
jgi:hypothetical protein